MSDLTERSDVNESPLSVILLADALSTETQEGLHGWQRHLHALLRHHEIIVLQEIRSEVAAAPMEGILDSRGTMRTITYDREAGCAGALGEAIRSAHHPLLVFCPCDSQYDPNDLAGLLKVINQVDLVVGYRVGLPVPFWRMLLDTVVILLSRIAIGVVLEPTVCWLGSKGRGRRWVARWIFGLRVNDPECPFRLARREIFRRIPIQSKGAFAQIEMLAKANHLTCMIAEAPVSWSPPLLPASEANAFANDAFKVFRAPDFGPIVSEPVAGAASTPASVQGSGTT